MDGREQLRRYLEQRKEAGERELVLDDLNVDDVMQILGASARGGAAAPKAQAPAAPNDVPRVPASTPPPGHASADWRDVLRSSGAAPGDPATPSVPATPPSAP